MPASPPYSRAWRERFAPRRLTATGFVCRTPCGETCTGGEPAWKVLAEELEYLGSLGGRDLLEEVATPQFLSRPRQELWSKETE